MLKGEGFELIDLGRQVPRFGSESYELHTTRMGSFSPSQSSLLFKSRYQFEVMKDLSE